MKGDTILFTSSCVVTMQKQTLVGSDDVENNWLLFVNINNNDICISSYKVLHYFWNTLYTHRYEVNFYKIKNTIEFLTILLQ